MVLAHHAGGAGGRNPAKGQRMEGAVSRVAHVPGNAPSLARPCRKKGDRQNMKRMALMLLCAALSSTAVFAELSRVTVKGNQFVTADGQPIIFRGLDASDPD